MKNPNAFSSLIKECLEEVALEHYILLETLVLKRGNSEKYGPVLLAVSDEQDPKNARNETFRNKDKLKSFGFMWEPDMNSWVIKQDKLRAAQEALSRITQSPIEKFIEKVEEIPEFIANADNLSRKTEVTQMIDNFLQQLSTAVDDAAKSAIIRQYLEFTSGFHNYSFHNTMLIWLQKPNAKQVAGRIKWLDKHRRLKKGAQPITILAPYIPGARDKWLKDKQKPKPTTPTPPTTPQGGEGEEGGEGGEEPLPTPSAEKKPWVRVTRFIAVTVYDISDTEATDPRGESAEVEWHGSNDPNKQADMVFDLSRELAADMGIRVTQDKAGGGEQGWASGDHINLTSEIEGVNKASTIVHEIAHELMHFKKTSPFYVGDEEKAILTRAAAELQAESVSFVVMKFYGLPCEHHANYLAIWKSRESPKNDKNALEAHLTIVRKVSKFIINEMEKIREAHEREAAKGKSF